MVGSLVGADGYAAHAVEQLHPVHLEDVGIVLRDDVFVTRELAYHKPADKDGVVHSEHGVGIVEAYRDVG